ncbi:MAG TPA: TVP38/TMEM64 family protein [Isosphaeraceae bacterium]|jgi:uncharacterized membrane protein YdjX (TVP38/TMEM64 family)|nr:TVP38/TMEM64 family protein [Isosphaeraceae bacterium]
MLRFVRHPAVRGGLVLLVLLGVALAWRALPVSAWVERALGPIQRAGAWGGLGYVLAYVVFVVLLIPGTPMTLAGGYLYGPVVGSLLVSLASTMGAAAAFLVARTLVRERVRRAVEHDPRFDAIDRAVARRGAWVVLLLRLSPMVPFNVLNYALGMTGVGFWPYVLASWVGMMPSTIVYVLVGASGSPGGQPELLGPVYWVVIVTTTIVATGYVGWLAKRALQQMQEPAGSTAQEPSP